MRRLLGSSGIIALLPILSSCFSPSGVHVSYGTRPEVVDDDVRFRTTYYFRVFDYCWAADKVAAQTSGEHPRPISYRAIIPETDTLYRYRMTGKASALFSNVRFSSGTLPATAIDPFGTDVSYSDEAKGWVVRSATEVKDAANAAEARMRAKDNREAAWARYQRLLDVDTKGLSPEALTTLEEARKTVLMAFVGSATAADTDAQLATFAASLSKKIDGAAEESKAANKALLDEVAQLRAEISNKPTLVDGCPVGDQLSKGFQIMGPEGIRTFRQDERLLLAMSSSAQPLIETLQEYSHRVLNPKLNRSEVLLPIARESVRTETARRAALEAAVAGTATSPFAAARTEFEAKP